jgi:disulfide bond formation protein DsbB
MTAALARLLNALALLGIGGVLAYAFIDQFLFADLPCPLCLLQRAGFVLAGFGFALNVLYGPRPSHYALAVLGAVAGAAVSVRQILLHIVPGTGTYGEALFGLHFYTWALVAFVMIVAGSALLLLLEGQFSPSPGAARPQRSGITRLGMAAVAVFGLLILMNAGSTLAECGLGLCPDDPEHYELLQR